MSNKIKKRIATGYGILGGVFAALFLIIPIVGIVLGKEVEEFDSIWIGDIIASGVWLGGLFILSAVLKIEPEPVEAEKRELPFDDFETLLAHFDAAAAECDYERQPEHPCEDDARVIVFVRSSGPSEIDSLAFLRVAELTDEAIEAANRTITETLLDYYNTDRITDSVNMITVICVDRITPPFRTYVNSGIEQGPKNGFLPVGASFGGKGLYLARQKDGYAIARYKRLRKEFLTLLEE